MEASFEPTLNILAAYSVLQRKYGITMAENDFLEDAYQAFKDINSVPVQMYKSIQKPQSKDTMIISVPCNLYKLVSITASPAHIDGYDDFEPYSKRTETNGHVERLNVITGNSDLKTYHFNDTPYTGLGTYLSFEWVDATAIKIHDKSLWDTEIYIIYEGIKTDEDGLPMITRKHANAIAAQVAKSHVIKKLFSGDATLSALLPMITQDAARLMQAAAIPEQLTDNQLDEMLNEHTRADRKRHNRSFKFRRG